MASMASHPRLGWRRFHGKRPGAVDVDPVILPVHTQRGLIDVHGRRGQQAFDGVALPLGE